jgi:hypothetical protein
MYDSLIGNAASKHLWIKKATGLGVSEFMLRFMFWLCVKDKTLAGSQMCIVTGPRIDLAIALIDRMKNLFASTKGIAAVFDTKETVIELNGANPSFIRSLKLQIGEPAGYLEQIASLKSAGWTEEQALKNMRVIPVNFNKESKPMLGHCKLILEETDPRRIATNPAFDKLITSLRTAVDNEGVLDKEGTSYNDIFDAFRLALKFYQFQEV